MKSMKPVIRYQSQLLSRKSYKPTRIMRIRPDMKPGRLFRPQHPPARLTITAPVS